MMDGMKKTRAPEHGGRAMIRLLRFALRGPAAMIDRDEIHVELEGREGQPFIVRRELVGSALAAGLLLKRDGLLLAAPAAGAFLRRTGTAQERAFQAQHADLERTNVEIAGSRAAVDINRSESPLAALARLKDRGGALFFPPDAIAAGERLAADFTRGGLQPRMTASWEPRLAHRGSGARGGMADLADSAVAGRLAVNRAVEAMGPELAGVALDVCCFMKGLELVERERQWPIRSAKLMLRTALMALARHYAPRARARSATRHWGTDDFRPELSNRPE